MTRDLQPSDDPTALRRLTFEITGIVQGVGFRPTIYRLARAAGLGGSIQNRSGYVRLVLEGPLASIRAFLTALPASLPPNARLDAVAELENCPLDHTLPQPFRIDVSGSDDSAQALIPADLAICPDCLCEILEPANRRYGYAFTTCTCCGPRYTVINGMPYDRIRTTMSVFPLCAACQREYDDPADRRFHAESIACPDCGPRLCLEDAQGNVLPGDPLRQARAALAAGAVVAVRGVGGFLIAADATNSQTLVELRRRKNRPHKPFAVMARDLTVVASLCHGDPLSSQLLASAAAPIVILDVRSDEDRTPGKTELEGAACYSAKSAKTAFATKHEPASPCPVIDLLAPDTHTLGVMLPTTPLHALLATPLAGDPTRPFDWLVMTSGNRGGEPICITNDEARNRLCGIADYFLLHNREINLRCDDSIVVPCSSNDGGPRTGKCETTAGPQQGPCRERPDRLVDAEPLQVWRRARGFAPAPILLAHRLRHTVLAMGAELKNTIAIGFDDRVIASPHIGDLEALEAVDGLRQVAEALPRFVNRIPECVAVDQHPDMHSSRIGREIAKRLSVPVREIQHHHAHAAACLGEHGLLEGLALVFDGTGLGPDGHIWGAELLEVRKNAYRRLASFDGVPLPGGDAAVQRPARQLAGRCLAAGIDLSAGLRAKLSISDREWQVWMQQCETGVNAPVTHAAGRLFDTFAVVLGVARQAATYEGQTAIRLEAAAQQYLADSVAPSKRLPDVSFRSTRDHEMLWIDWREGVAAAVSAAKSLSPETRMAWAYSVHVAIAAAAAEMIRYGTETTGQRVVALSGGVFMNRILNRLLVPQLEAMNLSVLLHHDTPPNDGCIAIGQAIVAGEPLP